MPIQTIAPQEAKALIAAGNVDIVDVRDPRDWAVGHVPGARNVPLEDLTAGPPLARDKILFVCARGMRSQTAARHAERQGLKDIYSLDGGMLEWASKGMPIESAPEAAPIVEAAAPAPAASAVSPSSCGLPAPGLEAIVGQNLKALRTERNLSLDSLARLTGLSRTLLGQIELGKASPNVNVVWSIARAFDVHFAALLATNAQRSETTVLRAATATRLASSDGRYSSRALFSLADRPDAEFYELYLGPHHREDAHPHQPGTRENLIVVSGKLELQIAGERFTLGAGDAIVFAADVPHVYENIDKGPCWIHLVMTYVRSASGTPTQAP